MFCITSTLAAKEFTWGNGCAMLGNHWENGEPGLSYDVVAVRVVTDYTLRFIGDIQSRELRPLCQSGNVPLCFRSSSSVVYACVPSDFILLEFLCFGLSDNYVIIRVILSLLDISIRPINSF